MKEDKTINPKDKEQKCRWQKLKVQKLQIRTNNLQTQRNLILNWKLRKAKWEATLLKPENLSSSRNGQYHKMGRKWDSHKGKDPPHSHLNYYPGEWGNKNMMFQYNRTLSNQKEQSPWSHMNELHNHDVEWKGLDTKST